MDSSSMFSLESWDLASGEAISQSPPLQALGARALFCPPPTLDTDEFIADNAFSEDYLSVDSMAEFGLAPGEVRSQSPLCTFYGSQVPQGPPPSLDTQEFEKDLQFVDPWIVEDSQAPGEWRSQGTLDPPDAFNQFCSSPLGVQEFEHSRLFSGDMVEDSLPPWDSTSNESRLKRRVDQFEHSKLESLPSSVDVSANTTGRSSDDREQNDISVSNTTLANFEAGINSELRSTLGVPLSPSFGKRSLSPTSPEGNISKKQAKSGAKLSGEFISILPVPSTGKSTCRAGLGFMLTEKNNTDSSLFSSPNQMLPGTVFPTISNTKPAARDDIANDICNTSSVRESVLTNITNATISKPISPMKPNRKEKRLGSPINDLADYSRISSCEEVFSLTKDSASENCEVVLPPANEGVLTTLGIHSFKTGIISASNEDGPHIKVTDLGADCIGEQMLSGPRAKARVQTCLGFVPITSRKSEQQSERWDTDGWLCPRSVKRLRLTSKQDGHGIDLKDLPPIVASSSTLRLRKGKQIYVIRGFDQRPTQIS